MIITIVTDVLGKENNGTTIAAMNLIRALRSRGHEVRVLCPDETKKDEPGFYIVPIRNLGPLNPMIKANGVQLASVDRKKIREAVDGADVVHVMLPFKLGRTAAKYANEQGIPVTGGFHMLAENFSCHIGMTNFKPVNQLVYKWMPGLYRQCFAIHYPTQFLRDLYEGLNGPTNGYVISNGVNSRFKPTEVKRPKIFQDKFVILYTGRLSREKSHKILIDGVNLSKYRDRIQLVFAGAGPRRQEIERHAKKLPNAPVIRFFSRDDMVKMVNSADLYAHPAEIEAEGISCLEALSAGLVPVISDSPRSATGEYALDEKNLFHYDDPSDLAAKIDWWIEHPEEKAKRSREYVEYASNRFDQEVCMDAMEGMLKDAAARRESPKNGD